MKNVSGCASVNVLPYVFSTERTPSNSSAGWPLTAFARNVGAWSGKPDVRSRPEPLRSLQRVTGAPLAYVSCEASNHIWRPAVTGGASPFRTGAGVTTAVGPETTTADPTEFDAV